jgi:cobalt/nickel transport system ATP-binding protein
VSHRSVALVDVHCGYPTRWSVLRGASLHVPASGRLALLGANGSGKSTLLRCLSGALCPSKGRVDVDGVPVEYGRRGLTAHRQVVQLVVQDPDDQLFSASVRADISFGPVNLRLPEAEVAERVEHCLDLLALQHLADRPTHHLSYGERKRVAIAGAYAMHPCVLALDEPTAGLDPQAVRETLHALDRLHRDGTTLVLATHDVSLALAWADTVAVVVDGQVHQGDPMDILDDAALVARARLERPWILAVSERLHRLGLLATDVRPRTESDLVAVLDAVGGARSDRTPRVHPVASLASPGASAGP